MPDVAAIADRVARAVELARRGAGEVMVRQAAGRGQADAARLERLFTEVRQDDWPELAADCGTFSAEIDAEIGKAKLTLAELEEEQSPDRQRRWHRELAARDVSGAPGADQADWQLKGCAERLAEYTGLVFRAIHQM